MFKNRLFHYCLWLVSINLSNFIFFFFEIFSSLQSFLSATMGSLKKGNGEYGVNVLNNGVKSSIISFRICRLALRAQSVGSCGSGCDGTVPVKVTAALLSVSGLDLSSTAILLEPGAVNNHYVPSPWPVSRHSAYQRPADPPARFDPPPTVSHSLFCNKSD